MVKFLMGIVVFVLQAPSGTEIGVRLLTVRVDRYGMVVRVFASLGITLMGVFVCFASMVRNGMLS